MPNSMKNIIVDLDGTLALERHRRRRITISWQHYFDHIHMDPVNCSVLRFLEIANERHSIYIFTSRPQIYESETRLWLQKHRVPYDFLEMRSAADTQLEPGEWQSKRTDHDVKLEMIMKHRIGPSNTFCVLEDRDEMCDFYRQLGYDCWQVHPQHEMYTPEIQANDEMCEL